MAIKNTEPKRDEKVLVHVNELPAFVPTENPRITEGEQLRLEKRARIFFKEAIAKMRGKQWDLTFQDIDETRRICKILNWQEGMAHLDKMRDIIASRKTEDALETHSRAARERFDKTRSARAERVTAEHDRLEKREQATQDRLEKLRNAIGTSKNLGISRLADMLEIDEASVKSHVSEWATEFGFKINADKIVFGNGKIDDFIDALDKQFST